MIEFRQSVLPLKVMYFILFTSIFWGKSVKSNDACLSGLCDCDQTRKTADCSNRSLTYIPTIGKYIRKLKFGNNLLERLNRLTLSNITDNNITVIEFMNNKIFAVDDTIGSNKHLKTLDLSFNSITSLNSFITGIKHLFTLDLSFNPLSATSVVNLFKSLNNSSIKNLKMSQTGLSVLHKNFCRSPKLQNLVLSNNDLKIINLSDMKQCLMLKYLDVSQNSISEFIVEKLDQLYTLDVSHNKLKTFPNLCQNSTNFLQLQYLNIFNNSITTFAPETIGCLKKVRSLHFQRNYITFYPTNSFNQLPDLTTLHVGYQKIKKMLVIEPWTFNNSKLTSLSLNSAYLSKLGAKSFFGCSNLKSLNLESNSLSSNLSELSPLKHLHTLKLSGNNFKSIPSVIIDSLHLLQLLDLGSNAIQSWDEDIFDNSTRLQKLYLKRNLIQTVTKKMFPRFLRMQLHQIDLSENPFSCTCEMVWLVQWMKANREKFIGYPEGYPCLTITKRICMGEKDAFLGLTLVLSAIIIIIFAVVVLYKYRCENTDQLD